MTETLVIKLPVNPDADVVWVKADSSGAITSEPASGALADAAGQATGCPVTVLLPATDVLRLESDIPLKGTAKILQALPFALEEQLAQDVETLHFAIGERNSGQNIQVAVIETDRFNNYLQELNAAGIFPTAVFSKSDAIATIPSTTVMWLTDEQLIVREANGSSSVFDPDELETVLELRFSHKSGNSDANTEPLIIYCTESANATHEDHWDPLRAKVSSLDIKLIADGGIGKLAGDIMQRPGINLLQGEFGVRTDMFAWWPFWRNAAALLLVAALLSLALDGITVWQLSRQEAALDNAASDTLTRLFPGAAGSPDPWGQLQSRLQTGGTSAAATGPGFVQALVVLADALDNSSGIKVDAVNFRNGVIDLRLQAPAVENLDKFRQNINDSGTFNANIQSANPGDSGIKGRMQVKVNGA